MSSIPEYTHNVSLRLSQVMDEIGVNERIVMKRRRSGLLIESMMTLAFQAVERDTTFYHFGSQIEGTTTLGLNSDSDALFSLNKYNVIHDWSEWEHGKRNLLMIQDDSVSPGYCLLQLLRDDAPLPAVVQLYEHSYKDSQGRILLRNTLFHNSGSDNSVIHGPAHSKQNVPGTCDRDSVPSFPGHSCLVQVRQWVDQYSECLWPSHDTRQYCSNTPCFVVPVGMKGSVNEDFEWRISTSLAERCLMFNLNITQIRCYVLMKMILKTFISRRFPESISSFMCKNVLLYCALNTRADEWKESNLLPCLQFCLITLYNCVLNEYCPHFIIQDNNLMFGRFSSYTKPSILEILQYVIESNGRALLEIEYDNVGLSLQLRSAGLVEGFAQYIPTIIAGHIGKDMALTLNTSYRYIFKKMNLPKRDAAQKLSNILSKLCIEYHTHVDKTASCLLAQHLCCTLGSVLAFNIYHRGNLKYEALHLMSLGLNIDVTSCKLKLASVFFCIGDTERTERILKCIEESYDYSVVEPICACCHFKHSTRESFNRLCYESNEEHKLLKHITASCVRFVRCELNCCPDELQHEMYRSTQKDLTYRSTDDDWMDTAVVDSLPFLYFLQYKTYSRLGRERDRKKALSNLVRAIQEERNLGHRETALNLLGQCMEIEQRRAAALKCYMLSLQLRSRNNAAKFHICRLLSTVLNGR